MDKRSTSQLEFQFPTVNLCECGCGQLAPIATRNRTRGGMVKGKPMRFVVGHNNYLRERAPLAERFWAKVCKTGDDECWLWQAATNNKGYGTLGSGGKHGTQMLAHRVSWELHYGEIPSGLQVLHNCEVRYPIGDITNRRCVNPLHLWIGSAAENSQDMVRKGRANGGKAFGENHSCARITDSDVRDMRARASTGESAKSIATSYGMNTDYIREIIKGTRWGHVR